MLEDITLEELSGDLTGTMFRLTVPNLSKLDGMDKIDEEKLSVWKREGSKAFIDFILLSKHRDFSNSSRYHAVIYNEESDEIEGYDFVMIDSKYSFYMKGMGADYSDGISISAFGFNNLGNRIDANLYKLEKGYKLRRHGSDYLLDRLKNTPRYRKRFWILEAQEKRDERVRRFEFVKELISEVLEFREDTKAPQAYFLELKILEKECRDLRGELYSPDARRNLIDLWRELKTPILKFIFKKEPDQKYFGPLVYEDDFFKNHIYNITDSVFQKKMDGDDWKIGKLFLEISISADRIWFTRVSYDDEGSRDFIDDFTSGFDLKKELGLTELPKIEKEESKNDDLWDLESEEEGEKDEKEEPTKPPQGISSVFKRMLRGDQKK